MMKGTISALACGSLLAIGLTFSASAQAPSAATVEVAVKGLFDQAPAAWQAKAGQDATQAACSQLRDNPPAAEAAKIMAREKATVAMPADGKVIGDWKKGEKLAQNGYGGRSTDKPTRESGGNCYACHQLSKKEVSFGTMGPPLVEYGKVRKYAEADAKAVYEKIYNAQASVACSKMPRLGHSKHLNEQQIKDIVALLFDPESPVNK